MRGFPFDWPKMGQGWWASMNQQGLDRKWNLVGWGGFIRIELIFRIRMNTFREYLACLWWEAISVFYLVRIADGQSSWCGIQTATTSLQGLATSTGLILSKSFPFYVRASRQPPSGATALAPLPSTSSSCKGRTSLAWATNQHRTGCKVHRSFDQKRARSLEKNASFQILQVPAYTAHVQLIKRVRSGEMWFRLPFVTVFFFQKSDNFFDISDQSFEANEKHISDVFFFQRIGSVDWLRT